MKGGKVRCGHCHQVFNAQDNLLADPATESATTAVPGAAPASAPANPPSESQAIAVQALPRGVEGVRAEAPPLESARDAGLVAARELSETPAFNRWAAGTMAGDGSIGLDVPSRPRRRGWLLGLAVLLLTLASQAVYHFRSDILAHEPRLASLFTALEIDVPRPMHGELIAVESTELRANGDGPGLLLGITLKNRAPYAQAWPMLELTLKDANDNVVVRRVFAPADYLSIERQEAGFTAHGEVGVKLVLDAGDLPATGYSLYAFYH